MDINKLNAKKVRTAKPRKYEDRARQHLVDSQALNRQWVVRYTIYGKRREMGLGSFPLVTLGRSRNESLELRRLAKNGVDPFYNCRREQEQTPSFTTYAARFIRAMRCGWKTGNTQDSGQVLLISAHGQHWDANPLTKLQQMMHWPY